MEGVGKVSHRLAEDFGLVGVAGRASGIDYDARCHFDHGISGEIETPAAVELSGDVFSRANVRVREIVNSLNLIDELVDKLPAGSLSVLLPDNLRANQVGLGIVESHRGELIHLLFTDGNGTVRRYAIKDPSVNNWTALAIAARKILSLTFRSATRALAFRTAVTICEE